MSSSPAYSEHEKYADAADEYLDQHNIYELLGSLLRDVVIHRPADPLAFMLAALQQPTKAARVLVVAPPHPAARAAIDSAVRDTGLLRLRMEGIVAAEAASGSPIAAQAAELLHSGQPLPDSLAVPLLAARVARSDALAAGWLLEGWPQTRASALAMQAAGLLPTHLLYFTGAQPPQPGSNEEQSEGERAGWESHARHGVQVQEVFAHVAHFIDLSKPAASVAAEALKVLNAPPRSKAPKRPLRVFLLGPRGSGRHTQAALLAHKYGLVHINPSALLRAEMKRQPALRARVQQYLQGGMLVPDEIIAPLVVQRVLSNDARARGFVLEGFPRTAAQVEALQKADIRPSRVVVLRISDAEAAERVSARRIDPHTGDEYILRSAADEAALPSALRDRLQHQPNDQSHALEAINFTYSSFIDEVKAAYASVTREIEAGGRKCNTADEVASAKAAVLEAIEDFLLAPINHHYAHVENKRKQQQQTEEKAAR